MKKVLIVAAAAGLFSLAACNKADTGNATVDNAINSAEANAAVYENAADLATNDAVEANFENAASAEETKADALHDNAQ